MSTNFPNPYQAPSADLDYGRASANAQGSSGSVETAVRGQYDFEIGDVMKEAWGLVPGFKAPVLGVTAIAVVVMMVAGFVSRLVMGAPAPGQTPNVGTIILQSVLGLASIPLWVGMIMMGARRAAGLPVSFNTVFEYLPRAPAAVGAGFLSAVLMYIGFILLVIPGLYLSIAWGMTLPLVADKGLSPWQAMETSRKALTHRWFKLFGLYFAVGLVVTLSAFLLLVPLIWTIPWSIAVMGVTYRRIFGVSGTLTRA